MGALVFSLPQRNAQRILMPRFCFVHSAVEAALKIALLESEFSQKLVKKLRAEALQNVDVYMRAPSWSVLEAQLFNSMGIRDDNLHCTPPSLECRTYASDWA